MYATWNQFVGAEHLSTCVITNNEQIGICRGNWFFNKFEKANILTSLCIDLDQRLFLEAQTLL